MSFEALSRHLELDPKIYVMEPQVLLPGFEVRDPGFIFFLFIPATTLVPIPDLLLPG